MNLSPAAPNRITSLLPHQVFVFGSNTQGRHGRGAALTARNLFGAQYGNPRGHQGQSYAIITKDLSLPKNQQLRSITLDAIEAQIVDLCAYAKGHPELEFLVTRFGCQNAGYAEQEIGNLWVGKDIPSNMRLPQAFINVIDHHYRSQQQLSGAQASMSEPAPLPPKLYNPIAQLTPLNAAVARHQVKDVAMGEVATQFIGTSSAPSHIQSSTRNYTQGWDELGLANTGNYSPNDTIMVSGSGPWRGVTMPMIERTFNQRYVPLLEQAIAARAAIVVRNAAGTDKLVRAWLVERGYKLEEHPDGYGVLSHPQRDLVAPSSAQSEPPTMQPVRITIASLYDAERILSSNSLDKPTHVISIGMPDDLLPASLETFPHIRLEFADTRDENHQLPPQRHHVEQAIEFGREAQTANGHLLIHCGMGVSRSSGVALAVLADQMQEYSPKDVLQKLDGIKEDILPNALLVRWVDELIRDDIIDYLPYAKDLPLPNPPEEPIMAQPTIQDWQQFCNDLAQQHSDPDHINYGFFQVRGNDLCWQSPTTGLPISMTLGDDGVLQLTVPTGMNETQNDPEVTQTLSNAHVVAAQWQQWCQNRGISLPQTMTYPGQTLQGFYDLDITDEESQPFRAVVKERQQQESAIDSTTPIIIACDGACSGNPGPGGWGAIVQYPDGTELEIGGSNPSTTNNRMELTALIEALSEVYSNSEQALTFANNPIQVIADSQYVINGATGVNQRSANKDLWAQYETIPTGRTLSFGWVRGHEGHPLNERADKLAVQYRDLAKQGIAQEGQRVRTSANAQLEDADLVLATAANEPQGYPCYVVLSFNTSGQSKLNFYQTWNDCQKAVNGVSGVKYKKVADEFELNFQLEKWGITVTTKPSDRAIDLSPSSSPLSSSPSSQGGLSNAQGVGAMSNEMGLNDVSGFAQVVMKGKEPIGDWVIVQGGRDSVLGNPFLLQNSRSDSQRQQVISAHNQYYERIKGGEEPTAIAQDIAQKQGLTIPNTWKAPTRVAYIAEWQRIDDLVAQGNQVAAVCYCGAGRCHLDALAQDWNRDRSREPNPFEQPQIEGNTKGAIAISETIAPGINIYSRSREMGGLGAALTNPSSWAKGRGLLTHSYPVTYNGTWYVDAEAAYQRLKQGDRGEGDRELMVGIIAHKLIQHAELIAAINQCGGTQWLEQCRHQTGAKNLSLQWWEGEGRNSPFIERLIEGYERALAMVKDQGIELPTETPFAIPTQEQIMTATAPSAKRDDIEFRSGGQTGADMGGLLGAEALGIPTGGVAPHGWLVEKCDLFPNGRNPELGTRFGLIEGPQGKDFAETMRLRTRMNIEGTEGTAIFGSAVPGQDPGTYLTKRLCEELEKPWIHFKVAELDDPIKAGAELRQWLIAEGIRTLNVAGNRESRHPGLEDKVSAIVQEAVRERLPEKGLEAQEDIAPPQVAPIAEPAPTQASTATNSLQCHCHMDAIEPVYKEGAITAIAQSVGAIVMKAATNGHQGVVFTGNAVAIPVLKNAIDSLNASIIVSINHAPMANLKHLKEGDVLLLVTQKRAQLQTLVDQATQQGVHVLGYDCQEKGYFNNKQPQQVTTAHLNGKGAER